MVDYLCLKLSMTSEQVIDMPYFDCKRKVDTYRAMDRLEAATPIIAYPILGEEGGRAATERYEKAQEDLRIITGLTPVEQAKAVPTSEPMPDDPMLRRLLEMDREVRAEGEAEFEAYNYG